MVSVYGFKIWSSEYEKGKYRSVGVAAVRNGSTRVWPSFTKFSFMFAAAGRQGLVRVKQELQVETGQNSLLWGLHSGNAVTHSQISNRVHTELKPYRPSSTRIDPHCNLCQFLMDSVSTIRRRKKFWSCSKFLHWFRFHIDICIGPVRTALTRF
jgi:hypothetical protein